MYYFPAATRLFSVFPAEPETIQPVAPIGMVAPVQNRSREHSTFTILLCRKKSFTNRPIAGKNRQNTHGRAKARVLFGRHFGL
jgi:hypothetical protein